MQRLVSALLLALCLLATGMPAGAQSTPLTNTEIVRLVKSGVSDSVLAAMVRNQSGTYDLSPDAIVALKKAGAGDETVKAMLESGAPKTAPSAMPGAAAAPKALAVRVSLLAGPDHRELAANVSKVAQSQMKGPSFSGGGGLGMLGGFAGSALSMMPGVGMLGGALGGLGGLFGHRPKISGPEMHQVWALEGPHASTEIASDRPTFEVAYANVSGLDPDRFAPAIVRLVQTKDNWRLVGASKSSFDMNRGMNLNATGASGSPYAAFPIDSIDEARVAADVQSLGRGRARITPQSALGAGEYAVVLRPVDAASNDGAEASAQTLSSVIASVWDFSIAGASAPASDGAKP